MSVADDLKYLEPYFLNPSLTGTLIGTLWKELKRLDRENERLRMAVNESERKFVMLKSFYNKDERAFRLADEGLKELARWG